MRARLYSCVSLDEMHPALARYLTSDVPQSARFEEGDHCFHWNRAHMPLKGGGIHKWLKARFYPHHEKKTGKRDKRTKLVGSSTQQGITVDNQLALAVEGQKPRRWSAMTRALLDWWKQRGHTLQACQVPVQLVTQSWESPRMTKADVITRCEHDGTLWLWEVKTGAPIGLNTKHEFFKAAPLQDVPCTERHIWFLQLHYTHQALETMAGLHIDGGARVIQVHARKGQRNLIIEEHAPPAWLTTRVPLRAVQPRPSGVPIVLETKTTGPRKREREEQETPKEQWARIWQTTKPAAKSVSNVPYISASDRWRIEDPNAERKKSKWEEEQDRIAEGGGMK